MPSPNLTIPDELVDLELEGRVSAVLTIGGEGRVTNVQILKGLHPVADAACVEDLRKMTCKPGMKDDVPVIVTGFPYSCRYEMAVD